MSHEVSFFMCFFRSRSLEFFFARSRSLGFAQTAANTELLLLILYSLSPRACLFDQVSAGNNHAHALMLKSHENMVDGLYF